MKSPFQFHSGLKTQLNIFLTAMMFLTRLPVSRWVQYDAAHLAKSTAYFPVVGALVGTLSGATLFTASFIFPAPVAVLLSLLMSLLVTGAFHEDGLADTADGFGGGFSTERVLEIMKDSRIGTYGGAALWLALTFKFVLLTELFSIAALTAVRSLVAAGAVSRCASLVLIYSLPYVRESSATSKPFADSVSVGRLAAGCAFSLLITFLLFGWASLAVLTVSLLFTLAAGGYFESRIGGITGDTLGAATVVVELTVYAVLVALPAVENLIRLLWNFF